MGISVVGLIVMFALGVIVIGVSVKGLIALLSLFKSVQAGHATLNCPHCGRETSPVNGRCQACQQEL